MVKYSVSSSRYGFRSIVSRAVGCFGLSVLSLLVVLPSQALEFPQTGDRGAPSRTSGGGTRGDRCNADTDDLIRAIVPQNNVSTFAEPQAKLWLHLPAELTTRTAEVFVKQAETHEIVYEYQTSLLKLEQDGLIELILPASRADGSPLLADEQDYLWEFAIICDANDRTRDRYAQGLLHKVSDDDALKERLGLGMEETPFSMPGSLLVEKYAGAELWQEALQISIQYNRSKPHYWESLVTSVGLVDLADSQYAYPAIESMQPLLLPQAN